MVLALSMLWPATVRAQFATGGSGRFLDQIVWFSWGAAGTNIPQAGISRTNSTTVGGQFLRVTCTLSNIASTSADPDLMSYRPGTWQGDGLDELYNINGVGNNNQLVVGLANRVNPATVTARFSCSATLGPNNNASDPAYPLQGLVFADAEQSASNQGEYIEARVASSGTWRIIDRFRSAGCNSAGTVTAQTGANDRLRFNGADPLCTAGPMGVAFMEDVTAADFTLRGGGVSAIALGVMVFTADQGDAPASYGNALHLPGFGWTGGVPPESAAGTTTNYYTGITLADLTQPNLRLGAVVDAESLAQSNATATGDDAADVDDEDALATVAPVPLIPGSTYTLGNISCAGTGIVYGYIDLNRDGDFTDAGERSAAGSCAGTSASLNWTLPATADLSAGASFLRLRIGSLDAQVSVPTGVARDGEVEDYAIVLSPVLRFAKTWAMARVNDAVNLTATGANVTGNGAFAATADTADETDTAPNATFYLAPVGSTVTLTEAFTTGAAGAYARALTCSGNTGAGAALNYTANATTGTLTVGSTAQQILCTFTNTSIQADLSITKTNNADLLTVGQQTTYTVVASNVGPAAAHNAVVRDTPVSHLTACSVTACNASGGAACPAAPADLLAAAGAAVPVFPAGGSVSFAVTCTVN
ncbi:MAG: DUF11 domain-containing protein [Lysobacter sp.]|nr:DUF11 domain-containing protein [Lysobacter sp.]